MKENRRKWLKNIIFFFFLILFCIPFKESSQDPTTKEGFIKRYLLYLSKFSGSGGGPIFIPAIGELDTTFGGTGKVTTDIGTNTDSASSIAIQPDGKILVTGYSYNTTTNYNDFAIVRYNTDGSLDTSFGGDGIVTTPIGSNNDYANAIAIQSDGKIVVAGYSSNGTNYDFAIVRYNPDGTLDIDFDGDSGTGNGIVTTPIGSSTDYSRAIAIQPDGKIVVSGYSYTGTNDDFAIVRYNSDGTLDTSFDGDSGTGNGIVTIPIGTNDDLSYALALQPDNKIVIAGYSYNTTTYNDIAVVRCNSNGTLDTSFDLDGIVTISLGNTSDDVAYAIAIQPDGKIVVAGNSDNGGNIDFTVLRYK